MRRKCLLNYLRVSQVFVEQILTNWCQKFSVAVVGKPLIINVFKVFRRCELKSNDMESRVMKQMLQTGTRNAGLIQLADDAHACVRRGSFEEVGLVVRRRRQLLLRKRHCGGFKTK